jgi:Xaa-Pro aminopeptidase
MTTDYGDFYQFETLSLCFIDTTLILKELMTNEEIDWLNTYHQMVYEKLSPYLTNEEKDWLATKTGPRITKKEFVHEFPRISTIFL